MAILLIARLESLSVDSVWARRASGLRGSLLKGINIFERFPTSENDLQLEVLVRNGFKMLEKAASEIPDVESILKDLIGNE